MKASLLIASCLCASVAQAKWFSHTSSSSQYIHSNDTIEMTLSSRAADRLHGAPDSLHSLEFVLHNRAGGGRFEFAQSSEDNFLGFPSKTSAYLEQGMQQTITISNMKVPQRAEGERIKFTLTATKDSFNKREAPPTQGGNNNNNNIGGGGNFPGGNNPNFPNINNNNNNNNFPNLPNFNDPSYKTEVAITVEFIVASEVNDDSKPWAELTYFAEEEEDTCKAMPGEPNCDDYMWWTKFKIMDEDSGLHLVRFEPEGEGSSDYAESIYYRYENFPIGTDGEYEVVAGASCCLEGVQMRVTDVAGNQAEISAENGGTGTPMSNGLKWGLIGGGIALAIIIAIVVVACCCKKRYSSVPGGE